jgi:molecular chaperone DnaK (HSP70)
MSKFLLDRRQFALGAAATVTTAFIHLPAGEALTQSADNLAELDKKTREAMAKLTPAARAEVETKVANITRKYGDRLSDEQKADIRRIMAESQDGLEKMRAFALQNGDQPADAFHAFRSETQPQSREQKK